MSGAPLQVPHPEKMDPEDVADRIRGGAKNLVIVDVRDGDYAGGHIKGCINVPSSVFNDGWRAADGLLNKFKSVPEPQTFVFHCMKSQVRGPSCAQRFVERINAQGLPAGMPVPEVWILRGGYEGWEMRYHDADDGLVEK